jgi:DNA polymerase-3 subunit epsilon
MSTSIDSVRFVSLDCETTGLDPRKDRIITIGAVAVRGGEILLDDSFEAMIEMEYNRGSVTVHGITRDETRGALPEEQAVEQFVAYLKEGIIVGHHIGHDIQCMNAALERHGLPGLTNRWLDTMDLTLHCHAEGGLPESAEIKGFSLDGLCDMFGVAPHDRHTAGGDAFITAQIFLRLLRAARRAGRVTIDALCEPYPHEQ